MKRSVILVACVAAAAVGLGSCALTPQSQPTGPVSSDRAASPPASPTDYQAAVTGSASCPATGALPSDDLGDIPGDLAWVTVDGATWPTSPTIGPTGERDDLPACFEHSDRGAALAAATILFAQVGRSPLQTWVTYAAPTTGRAKLVETLNGHSGSTAQDAVTTPGVAAVGYRIEASAPDRVDLTLALRTAGQSDIQGWPLALVWHESDAVGGDWLLRVREDGSIGDPVPIDEGALTVWPR